MNKTFISCLISCVSAFFLFNSCSDKKTDSNNVLYVQTYTVTGVSSGNTLEYPGRVVAAEDVNLGFKVSGTLQNIYVKEGAKFSKGQLIATIDPVDYQIQFNAVEAEYKKVKAEAERVISLYNDSVTTADAYDKARYGLQQITAKYENAKNQLSYTKLYAPFDGSMQKHLFDPGTVISAGMPVVSIISAGQPEIEINIPASTYLQSNNILGYTATFDYKTDSEAALSLISISPKANANQLYTVRLGISSKFTPQPSPGMNTTVKISLKTSGSKINIPASALFNDNDSQYVWIVNNDSTIVKRNIGVEFIHTDGSATISSGLENNDVIVTAGVHRLKEGQKVTPMSAPSKTNIGGLL